MRLKKLLLWSMVAFPLLLGCRNNQGAGTHALHPDVKAEIDKHQELGTKYRKDGRFAEAIEQHDSCIMLAEKAKDTIEWIIALNNQGTNFRRIGNLQEATDYHYKALVLYDELKGEKKNIAKKDHMRSLNGLGNIFMEIKNYEAAERDFRIALQGESDLNDLTGQAINLANIGSIKEALEQNDSARMYYQWSMEKNQQDNNMVGISLCHGHLGRIAEKENDIEGAMFHYRYSYDAASATGDRWHWLETCLTYASSLLSLGRNDSARIHINEAIETAEEIKSKEHLAKAYSLRAKYMEQSGNASQALSDYKRSQVFYDSIRNDESDSYIQNLRMSYISSKHTKDMELAERRAQYEKSTRSYVELVSLIVLALLVSIITMQIRANRIRKEAHNAIKAASEERQKFYREITHQLRTPMTVVTGMISQLRNHISKYDEEAQEQIDAVERQSKQILALMTKIIEAAKSNSTLPELGDIETAGDMVVHSPSNISIQGDDKYILVVEDTPDVAQLIIEILKNKGYTTQWAKNGEEALEMMNDELPDLIVTDIAMPKMDGLTLCKNIRKDENMNHLPIVVVSARVEDKERIEGIEAGAEAYLPKPFLPEELLIMIDNLLKQRELLKERFKGAATSILPDDMKVEEMDFMKKVNDAIMSNIGDTELSSIMLAETICISRSQLNRKIKNLTGMDTTRYIREIRMEYAKELLVNTDKSIGEIEVNCGYDTSGYFSRTFRKMYNMTPTEYRRKNRKNS